MSLQPRSVRKALSFIACVLALATVGCPADKAEILSSVRAECVPAGADVPEGGWVCPDAKRVECDSAAVQQSHTLVVRASESLSCDRGPFTAGSSGALAFGSHVVTVHDASGDAVCSAQLTVVDTRAPQVEAKTIALWPPNHKLHRVAVEDCVKVQDACDRAPRAEFIWASSDEPVNAQGDGNHDPDIQFDDCGHVSLRAERQGPRDGRVYRLGVRVTDSSGQQTEAECQVIVSHDQSGKARSADGETIIASVRDEAAVRAANANEKVAANEKAAGKGKANMAKPSHGESAEAAQAAAPDEAHGSGAKAEKASKSADVAVSSAEAYRLVFDGREGGQACGQGEQPTEDAGVPDGNDDVGVPGDESDPPGDEPNLLH